MHTIAGPLMAVAAMGLSAPEAAASHLAHRCRKAHFGPGRSSVPRFGHTRDAFEALSLVVKLRRRTSRMRLGRLSLDRKQNSI